MGPDRPQADGAPWLTVAGTGPGGSGYLLPAVADAVSQAEVLLGSARSQGLFPAFGGERRLLTGDLDGALAFLRSVAGRRTVVLLSGDPGFYSWLPRLTEAFGREGLQVIPGISSLQILAARTGRLWNRYRCHSLHGREDGLWLADIRLGIPVALLTDPRRTPWEIARRLLAEGLGGVAMVVGASLTLPEEEIWEGEAGSCPEEIGREGAVVLLD